MTMHSKLFSSIQLSHALNARPRTLVLALAIALAGTFGSPAAENAAAEKLLAEAKAKETHAQELRVAAATALQKAADNQMEAGV